jgi:hypothetical protein
MPLTRIGVIVLLLLVISTGPQIITQGLKEGSSETRAHFQNPYAEYAFSALRFPSHRIVAEHMRDA